MKTRAVFIPAVFGLAVGCGSSEPGNNTNTQLASVSFALSGGDFSGNSVEICGNRGTPADGKYRCDNSLTSTTDGGMPGCSCFNFDASGGLIDPNTSGPLVINGLCPSNDFPNADWTFTYSIFSEQDCMGTQLNDGTHNLTCFDSHDLAAMANANESLEPLNSGENINHILCVTENASKQFNFESCATANTPADTAAGDERFDCGCTPTGTGTCDCGENGVGAGDLPDGCSFDLTSCAIVCTCTTPPTIEPFIIFDGNSFINTGIDQTGGMVINTQFQFLNLAAQPMGTFFGAQSAPSMNDFLLKNTSGMFQAILSGSPINISPFPTGICTMRMDTTSTVKGISLSGCFPAAINWPMTQTVSMDPLDMYIGGLNQADNFINGWMGQLFFFDIDKEGVPVRRFVPARTCAGQCGLLDTLSDQFFGNSGAGTITCP